MRAAFMPTPIPHPAARFTRTASSTMTNSHDRSLRPDDIGPRQRRRRFRRQRRHHATTARSAAAATRPTSTATAAASIAGGDLTVKYSTISDNENDEAIPRIRRRRYSARQRRHLLVDDFRQQRGGRRRRLPGAQQLRTDGQHQREHDFRQLRADGRWHRARSLPLKLYNSTIAFNTYRARTRFRSTTRRARACRCAPRR